jgi:hypothetical protein
MSGLQKPKFHMPSAAEGAQYLASGEKFLSLKDGESATVRFLPPPSGYPSIFAPVYNHHGLKSADGGKGAALACLEHHGDDKTGRACLLCAAAKALDSGTDAEKKMRDEFRQKGARYYTQLLLALKRRNDKGRMEIFGWSSPKFSQWSKKAMLKLQAILNAQESSGDALYYDPNEGQGIAITRAGDGLQTDYLPERTGLVSTLDEIRPTWQDEASANIYEAVGLKVVNPTEQLGYLIGSFPQVKWEEKLAGTEFEDLFA